MKIFLHINSLCPCAVSVNGRYAGPAGREDFLHFEADGDEEILVSALPLSAGGASGEKILPFAALLFLKGGRLICGSPRTLLTDFPDNHYELTIAPERIYGFVPAAALKQEKFRLGGETHTATLIRDAACQLVCEGSGLLYTYVLPNSFSLKELSARAFEGGAYVIARGAARLPSGVNGEYAAVIAFDGAYSLNLGLLCDKIEFEGDSVQTLTKLNDIARRGVVMTYSLSAPPHKYEMKDSYAVYLMNRALKPQHERLIPFAFFQAVKAGDFAEARSFMSGSLSGAIAGDGALAAFFADFDDIEENRYYPRLKNCAALRKLEGNKAGLLLYSLDGDKKIDDLKII